MKLINFEYTILFLWFIVLQFTVIQLSFQLLHNYRPMLLLCFVFEKIDQNFRSVEQPLNNDIFQKYFADSVFLMIGIL